MRDRSGQQLGNYRVIRLLGRGGFAHVYLGEHLYLQTPVAIKIVQAGVTDEDSLKSFLKEARTVAHLVHPHIVRVIDFGVSDQTPFLVMDYASHGTLRMRHPKGVPLPFATILPMVRQIAAALQYAHDNQVIHRDIKPENMLVGRNDEVLLGDFGLALLAQSSRSQRTQDVIGTVAYMSPEQIQGKPRAASDQYALGMVIYEWLSGNLPFHGSFAELCTQHLFAPPLPLREKLPTLAPEIEQVILRALAKDPKQRFDSINAFASALEQASHSSQPVALAPPPAQPPRVPTPGAPPASSPETPPPSIISGWRLPDLSLLHFSTMPVKEERDHVAAIARLLQETLHSFRVYAEVREEDIGIGPTVIRFGIRPTGKPEMKWDKKTNTMVPVRDAAGNSVYETRTRVSRIMALQDDLTLALEAKTLRLEAPAAGRPYVSLELPRKDRQLVSLRVLLESEEYQIARAKSRLALVLGRDVAGRIRVSDLAAAHLLIAGEPESGKRTLVQSFLATILMYATPDDVRLLLIDPNRETLSLYNGIPHLLSPVVIEGEKVGGLLKTALAEMERRSRLFSQLNVRNLDGYRKVRAERLAHGNQTLNNLPAMVIIIAELADIMGIAAQEVEDLIDRLAQRDRATGIHLIIVTERPSRAVMTGLMKAMLPTRLSLKVRTSADSRTILGMDGAERLLGRGDLLSLPAEASQPERIQAVFLSDEEAVALVHDWRQQAAAYHRPTAPNDGDLDDDLLEKAEAVVREYGRASISLLQRRLKIGYSRAARLIDLLEERGVINHTEPGEKAPEVLDQHGPAPRSSGGRNGRTLADEAADIMEEERLRAAFLKKHAERDG